MTDPLSFSSSTPHHRLPLLFVGQSQKEATVNGAHALIDQLLHPAVEGEVAAPPESAAEGQTWLVSAGASGPFAGHDQALAWSSNGTWLFTEARAGMRVFDRATGQFLLFADGWRREPSLADPVGGTNVDAEARAAIVAILHLLRRTGILPEQ
jgi:hypothetical protein